MPSVVGGASRHDDALLTLLGDLDLATSERRVVHVAHAEVFEAARVLLLNTNNNKPTSVFRYAQTRQQTYMVEKEQARCVADM